MKYVNWAAFYEGPSDAHYFDVLLPRIIRHIVAQDGIDIVEVPDVPVVPLGLRGRSVDDVAAEVCSFLRAIDIVFIHADTGGRGLQSGLRDRSIAFCTAIAARCDWPRGCCITVTPKHETEAWLLSDPEAVTSALGYRGRPEDVGLPGHAQDAERLPDPKAVLSEAADQITGRRRRRPVDLLYPAIAQRQRLDRLRQSGSFRQFEDGLRGALRALHCIA